MVDVAVALPHATHPVAYCQASLLSLRGVRLRPLRCVPSHGAGLASTTRKGVGASFLFSFTQLGRVSTLSGLRFGLFA